MTAPRRFELRVEGKDLALFVLIRIPLVVLSLGLYLFLLPGAIDDLRIRSTFVEGQALRYRAGLGETISHAFTNLLLFVVTLGFALPYMSYRNLRFLYDHLSLPDGRSMKLEGSFGDYVLPLIGCWILTIVSGGLFLPWARAILTRWRLENSALDGQRLVFEGTGSGAAGHMLFSWLLCYVTCSLYIPWAAVRLWRWEADNTLLP